MPYSLCTAAHLYNTYYISNAGLANRYQVRATQVSSLHTAFFRPSRLQRFYFICMRQATKYKLALDPEL